MAELLKLYNTHLVPAINSLLDLGSLTLQWKDMWIDGTAYVDALTMEGDIEMSDNDIVSMGRINGFDNNLYIDMATTGQITFFSNAGGAPFSTPNFNFQGNGYFASNFGFGSTGQLLFRDTALYINSNDDGHLDFTADGSFDFNTTADTDITLNFTGTTNSGILMWMEDEDYFRSLDDLFLDDQQKVFFRDTDTFIHAPSVGVLKLDALTQIILDAPISAVSHSFTTTGTMDAKGYKCNVVTATSHYYPTGADDVIIMNPTGVGKWVYLPSAVGLARKVLTIKAHDLQSGETVTVDPISGQTIDGANSYLLNSDYGKVTIVSDGSNWFTI